MTAKGHIVLNIPIAMGSLYFLEKYYFQGMLDSELFILFLVVTIFGSLLPDIDEPESYIGKRVPVFSNVLSMFISHRGITHFLCVPLFFIIIAFMQNDIIMKIIFLALGIGIISHDVGDMLTKGGIRGFFFPFFPSRTIALLPKFLRFYTNSFTEYFVIASILCALVFILLSYPEILMH